jgi:hypothetical protein
MNFNINDFLVWLMGGGSIAAANWVLGQFSWYVALADKVKSWIFFAMAVLFGGGAYAVSQYVPSTTLTALQPYFLIVVFAFTYVFINHFTTKINDIQKTLKTTLSKLNK